MGNSKNYQDSSSESHLKLVSSSDVSPKIGASNRKEIGGPQHNDKARPAMSTDTPPTHRELDAKLETIEARMDGRLARIEDKFTLIERQFQSIDQRFDVLQSQVEKQKNTAWFAAGTIIATFIAVFAIYVAAFDSGRETAKLMAESQAKSAQAQQDAATALTEMRKIILQQEQKQPAKE